MMLGKPEEKIDSCLVDVQGRTVELWYYCSTEHSTASEQTVKDKIRTSVFAFNLKPTLVQSAVHGSCQASSRLPSRRTRKLKINRIRIGGGSTQRRLISLASVQSL